MDNQGEYRNFADSLKARQSELADQPTAPVDLTNDYCLVEPQYSAKNTFTRNQTISFSIFLIAALLGLFLHWEKTIIFGSLFFSGFYLAVALFRAAVLANVDISKPTPLKATVRLENKTYVILVALYKEETQIADLIRAIDRLKWTRGRKLVCLVCEQNDPATISAIRKTQLPPGFHLMIVPHGSLKTKPRALNYALKQVSGDYLVIYDAEDRPHPNQLIEAATRFYTSPEHLVCLQAPLAIDNVKESFLSRMFAIEYDTLFSGILPALTRWKAPMPLGGTSNHFQFQKLVSAGGWDSYNVTEDADLGIRLARKGMYCGVLVSPTFEEAPAALSPWLKQRTRWIKGWMQTLLVHTRNPLATALDMGITKYLMFHLVLTAVVISVLVHPLFLMAFGFQMINYFSNGPQTTYDIAITAISAFNLVAGYSTYALLAYAVQTSKPNTQSILWILLLPLYWVLLSIAGWRALYKIFQEPHHWEKTPHTSEKRKANNRQSAT
ncbi:MAG: glycosyltransferase family 2 protein [Salaquimonas sp.]